MSKVNSPCWLCCHSWKMVNGLFANKGPQAVKAAGANTQQHVLKKWGKEPSGLCGAAGQGLTMIWIPELENGPEGITVEGRKRRTSREKFKTSISDTLQTWWLLLIVAGAAHTWVLPRSRITSPSLWIPTVLNKIMMKKHLHPPVFAGLKEMKWRQHMWRSTQRGNLKSCYRQRQKILSLSNSILPSLADCGSSKVLLLQNPRHRWKGAKIISFFPL